MEPVLSVRGLSDEILQEVSFDVYAGEILGIAGWPAPVEPTSSKGSSAPVR